MTKLTVLLKLVAKLAALSIMVGLNNFRLIPLKLFPYNVSLLFWSKGVSKKTASYPGCTWYKFPM